MFKIQSIYINPPGISTVTKGAAKIFRIYKNPKARDLFIKSQKAKTVEERAKLLEQMGDYTIVTESEKNTHKNRFMQFIKGLFYIG